MRGEKIVRTACCSTRLTPKVGLDAKLKTLIDENRSRVVIDDEDDSVLAARITAADVASVNRGDYCMSWAAVGMATKLWAARLAEFEGPRL